MRNRPIILKLWNPDFDFKQEFMIEILLWVKFPKLPMSCWGCGSLGRIASALGKPLFADECTTKQMKISYARMLIEVNVSKPLPDTIVVMDPDGKKFQQEVEFEWKPQFCPKCQVIGHNCTKKPELQVMDRQVHNRRGGEQKKIVQEWKPKETMPKQNDEQQQVTTEGNLNGVDDRMIKLQQQESATPDEKDRSLSKGKEQMPNPELNLTNFSELSAMMVSKARIGATGLKQREMQRIRQAKPPDQGGPIIAQ
ncbi:PREDICTED: uncharacterized protein LOC109239887 [Nicotiana attenuata]|uniref:uncharacterized protein LOC109239887 n=1 Tax=Nicotiana attenuata TaxID=49451 RepID=UPI0009054F33|nr:PREDICTED: uncharacterized protein LOC109239887 [Nicotiana attenuata]